MKRSVADVERVGDESCLKKRIKTQSHRGSQYLVERLQIY